jgi:hypothetical protein
MLNEKGFNMELIVQSKTLSVHGLAEGHTGYIYYRKKLSKAVVAKPKLMVFCAILYLQRRGKCAAKV